MTSRPRRRRHTARRRHLVRLASYLLFATVVLVAVATADRNRVADAFLRIDIAASMFPTAVTVAMRNTLIYVFLAFSFGLVLGLILALMRRSTVALYRWTAIVYIEIFRGLPVLLVLFLIGYGIPLAFPERQIVGGSYGAVTAGLGLTAAAYMAETIRAGIRSVPPGQYEAARSLGMSHPWAMTSIVLPQALRLIAPPLTNEIISLTKDTSVVYVLGVTADTIELTKYAGDTLNSRVNPTPLVVAGLLYLVITVPLSQVVRLLEKHTARGS